MESSIERRARAKHFLGFCATYFSHYFYREPAPFHFKLAEVLQDKELEQVGIIGFRGSAKSTYASLAFILWSALEGHQNFIILIGDTAQQMKLNLSNIKYELENNEVLIADYGVMHEKSKNWSGTSLLLKNDVLILGRSRGQKIRGMRHRQFRPGLVVIDDPEDLEWVKKKENRDKTERWFTSEVVPAQREDNSKLIAIGNLLHNDCLLARLKRKGIMRMLEFPLFDENGKCTWEALYPTQEAIDKQKAKVGSETTWAREYLLKIISEDDQIIKETDLQYYPNEWLQRKVLSAGVGIDFAISKRETADYTAMVKGYEVMNDEGERRLLILPGSINKRFNFEETIRKAVEVNEVMPAGTKFYPEKVAYQEAAIEIMRKNGLITVPMTAVTDKTARLSSAAFYVKRGRVLFPEKGAEELIQNLLGFGIEDHDDLADAFSHLVLGMIKGGGGGVLFA